jgi:hypothetical protein
MILWWCAVAMALGAMAGYAGGMIRNGFQAGFEAGQRDIMRKVMRQVSQHAADILERGPSTSDGLRGTWL